MLSKSIACSILCGLLFVSVSLGTPSERYIVNSAFTVRASQARYWDFYTGQDGARVLGRFRAEGGGGNDIEVYILDEDQFENWMNGHRTSTYYNSGRVTVANINVNVPPGHFFLVFNNKYSILTSKAVTASVSF
ncbi:MAG: hypothetical protein ACREBG_29960 [Pyrinomonadaceae bacterium]